MTEEMKIETRHTEEAVLSAAKEREALWGTALLAAAHAGVLSTHSVICGERELERLLTGGMLMLHASGRVVKTTTQKPLWFYDPETGEGWEL